jgi:NAD-dependent SIR2 family protein deacetylase
MVTTFQINNTKQLYSPIKNMMSWMYSICGSDDMNELSEQLETIPSITKVEPTVDKREYKDSETLYKEKFTKFLDILEESNNVILLTEDHLGTPTPIEFHKKNLKYKIVDQPTKEHYMVRSLLRNHKKFKHVITCSYDGLHALTNLKDEELTEFYGSDSKEYCSKCKTIYQRLFDISKTPSKFRECEKCGGTLVEDKIKEKEQLDKENYRKVKNLLKNCDLILAIGCEFLTQFFEFYFKCFKDHSMIYQT